MWHPFKKKPKEPVPPAVENRVISLEPGTMNMMQSLLSLVEHFTHPPLAAIAPVGQPMAITNAYSPYIAESPEEAAKRRQETDEVDAFISTMEPQIKIQTEALIKEEVREMMLMGGNRQRILELLRAGKTPHFVRKKEGRRDPLFLQFGDGVSTPIEEIRVLG